MSQLRTRSGKYNLDTIYFSESIINWVDIIHTQISKRYGMKKIKIKPMDYGYDSYTYVLSEILTHISMSDIMSSIRNGPDIEKFLQYAHTAWIENYVFWKSIHVDELTDNPKASINTYERNDRATTHIKNINSNDLQLYTDIIEVVFEILTAKIFEAGMQQLAIV